MLSIYPACFFHDPDGYSVIFPDLDYLATCGATLEEAMAMAVDCLAGYIYVCRQDGDSINEPSAVEEIDPARVESDLAFEEKASEVFVSLVSVDVDAYAKEHFEKSVKKTLSIPAWLNKEALACGINFSQTLQEALVQKIKIKRQSIKT